MKKLPQHVKHIRHTHEEKKGTTWCGAPTDFEWLFQDLDHAAYNNIQGNRLIPCPECVAAAVKALTMGGDAR